MSKSGWSSAAGDITQIGAFITPSLLNVALTHPCMRDGGEAVLKDVVAFYTNGRYRKPSGPLSGFQRGGMRPLNITAGLQQDLVEFPGTRTRPEIQKMTGNQGGRES